MVIKISVPHKFVLWCNIYISLLLKKCSTTSLKIQPVSLWITILSRHRHFSTNQTPQMEEPWASTPPNSPTHNSANTLPSYLNTLISNDTVSSSLHQPHSSPTNVDFTDETKAHADPTIFIPLSPKEKSRLYMLWKYAVIVNVFGRKVGHQFLRQKIYA